MEIFAILIGLAILAAIAFYVSRPLVESRHLLKPEGVDALSLEAQRESLYTQIKELDLDHATGKVNEEDFTRIRTELVAQAANVLRQIDGIAPLTTIEPAQAATRSSDADVEALIAARRKTRSSSAPKSSEDDLEAAIAARRKTSGPGMKSSELACPQCGRPIKADDAFCAKCGTPLPAQVAR